MSLFILSALQNYAKDDLMFSVACISSKMTACVCGPPLFVQNTLFYSLKKLREKNDVSVSVYPKSLLLWTMFQGAFFSQNILSKYSFLSLQNAAEEENVCFCLCLLKSQLYLIPGSLFPKFNQTVECLCLFLSAQNR
jgi:hypothetical protein